ncbi:SLC13 family permease [Brevibacterium sp. K11IcPPYGO002]|uniref:SLC13 family permease n=1 Tax=Brevibacterium sp. K11IcPPYGO002 TaxID=3058837 RepID=UPI003D816A91
MDETVTFQLTALTVFIAVFAICSWRGVHIGIFMFPAACAIGIWLASMSLEDVVAGFPIDILVLLVGVTYFFSVARSNGTIDRLVDYALSRVGNKPALLPLVFFLLSLGIGAMGSPLASLVVVPIAMPLARRYKMDPMVMALAMGTGGSAGAFAPTSLFGIVTYGTAREADIAINPFAPFGVALGMNLLLLVCGFFIFGGAKLIRETLSRESLDSIGGTGAGGRSYGLPGERYGIGSGTELSSSPDHEATAVDTLVDGPPRGKTIFTGTQVFTIACIIGLVVAVIGLAIAGKEPDIGVLAFAFGAILTFVDPASGKKAIPQIDWSTVLLVGGIITYVGVLEHMGAVDLLGDGAASIGTPIIAALVICIIGGVVSAFASTTGILAALVPLALPLVANGGVTGWTVICALAVCSSIVDVSPFSTVGATFVATVEESQRERMTKLLLRWGLSMAIVGPVVLVGALVLPGTL